MSTWFDEKGKRFTDVVTKETVAVIIQTLTHRIQGRVHVQPDQRLKDEINQSDLFVAVTGAVIFDHSGNELYCCDFLALNRDQIVWIVPEDQIQANPDKLRARRGARKKNEMALHSTLATTRVSKKE